jgi:hypothetical protein
MKIAEKIMLLSVLAFFTAGNASAQDFFIYPSNGQSNDQMAQDKSQCYEWAKGQTGFDPMAPPTATSAPPSSSEPQSSAVKGAARGALVGVAVGAIAGNAGRGAAIGAASGGLMGGMRKSDQKAQQAQEQQQWEQQQAAQYQHGRDTYNRAYKACLEGRGYTVN